MHLLLVTLINSVVLVRATVTPPKVFYGGWKPILPGDPFYFGPRSHGHYTESDSSSNLIQDGHTFVQNAHRTDYAVVHHHHHQPPTHPRQPKAEFYYSYNSQHQPQHQLDYKPLYVELPRKPLDIFENPMAKPPSGSSHVPHQFAHLRVPNHGDGHVTRLYEQTWVLPMNGHHNLRAESIRTKPKFIPLSKDENFNLGQPPKAPPRQPSSHFLEGVGFMKHPQVPVVQYEEPILTLAGVRQNGLQALPHFQSHAFHNDPIFQVGPQKPIGIRKKQQGTNVVRFPGRVPKKFIPKSIAPPQFYTAVPLDSQKSPPSHRPPANHLYSTNPNHQDYPKPQIDENYVYHYDYRDSEQHKPVVADAAVPYAIVPDNDHAKEIGAQLPHGHDHRNAHYPVQYGTASDYPALDDHPNGQYHGASADTRKNAPLPKDQSGEYALVHVPETGDYLRVSNDLETKPLEPLSYAAYSEPSVYKEHSNSSEINHSPYSSSAHGDDDDGRDDHQYDDQDRKKYVYHKSISTIQDGTSDGRHKGDAVGGVQQVFHAYYGPADHVPPEGYVRMSIKDFDKLFRNAEIRYIDKEPDIPLKRSGQHDGNERQEDRKNR